MAVNKAKAKNLDANKEVSVLRIGCRFKSGMLTERLIQPGESVRIGPDPYNTFCLGEDFPKDVYGEIHTLFESKGGDYFLLFNEQTTGDLKRVAWIIVLIQCIIGVMLNKFVICTRNIRIFGFTEEMLEGSTNACFLT